MKNNDRLFNQLYTFMFYEDSRLENDLNEAIDNFGRVTLKKGKSEALFEIVCAKVRRDYFKGWCNELLDYLKHFDE